MKTLTTPFEKLGLYFAVVITVVPALVLSAFILFVIL